MCADNNAPFVRLKVCAGLHQLSLSLMVDVRQAKKLRSILGKFSARFRLKIVLRPEEFTRILPRLFVRFFCMFLHLDFAQLGAPATRQRAAAGARVAGVASPSRTHQANEISRLGILDTVFWQVRLHICTVLRVRLG